MPSLHIGWSTWCAIAIWPLLRRRWVKALVLLYPAATLFCIIVTGNHFWLDGVGGLIAFGAGSLIGWGVHRWNQDRLDRRHALLLTSWSDSPDEPPYDPLIDDHQDHHDHESDHEPDPDPDLDPSWRTDDRSY
jgi:hypothetical protein